MIHKHQLTRIGSFHVDHCEDYALIEDIGQNRLLLAVLDGCTMGDESYFASTLFGRLLRKISKEEYYKEYVEGNQASIPDQLKRVLARLFEEALSAKNVLQLNRSELLSTALIGIIDFQERQGEIICVGDGVVCVDGDITEFDQENLPDYLAYHLDEDFDQWYGELTQKISIDELEDISLCTDGILTFVDQESNMASEEQLDEIIRYLTFDSSDAENEHMFIKKMSRIDSHWNMINTDDLGIVRIIINDR